MTTDRQPDAGTPPPTKAYVHDVANPIWDQEAQAANWPMFREGKDLIVEVPSCPRCGHAFFERIPDVYIPHIVKVTTITVSCQCKEDHPGEAPKDAVKRGCGAVFGGIPIPQGSVKSATPIPQGSVK